MIENNKQKGRFGLSLAIAYFTDAGYTVSLPINDTQWYDLIIEKDGKLLTVQCKCTGTANNEISLRSAGGTKGSIYDNVLNHFELDLLFCCNTKGEIWVIPVSEIIDSGNRNSITLRNEPNKNNQGFQSYKFRVQFSFQAP